MSFQPSLPLSGLQGWSILTRTKQRQEAAFSAAAPQQTLVNRFDASFKRVSTVDDLLKDQSALRVVLGAFGLQDDLPNKGFIRKVISDGTTSPSALANRLADKRYFALAKALQHLGPDGTGKPAPELASTLTANFLKRSFEVAVGDQNQSFRLALSFERDLGDVLNNFSSDRARWFAVLGSPPLRRVLETALGLPKQFGALPVEQQSNRLQSAMERRFGVSSVGELERPEVLSNVIQRFLVMSEIASPASRFVPVLSLLQR